MDRSGDYNMFQIISQNPRTRINEKISCFFGYANLIQKFLLPQKTKFHKASGCFGIRTVRLGSSRASSPTEHSSALPWRLPEILICPAPAPAPNRELGTVQSTDAYTAPWYGYGPHTAHGAQHTAPVLPCRHGTGRTDAHWCRDWYSCCWCSLLPATPPAQLTYGMKIRRSSHPGSSMRGKRVSHVGKCVGNCQWMLLYFYKHPTKNANVYDQKRPVSFLP